MAIDIEQPGKRCGGVGKSLAATPASLNAFMEGRTAPRGIKSRMSRHAVSTNSQHLFGIGKTAQQSPVVIVESFVANQRVILFSAIPSLYLRFFDQSSIQFSIRTAVPHIAIVIQQVHLFQNRKIDLGDTVFEAQSLSYISFGSGKYIFQS
jgi:hypothetical protein